MAIGITRANKRHWAPTGPCRWYSPTIMLSMRLAIGSDGDSGDDVRVDGRSAPRHSADGFGQLGHVADAVLEQVPDAVGAVGKQALGRIRLDAGRQDDDPDPRVLRPDAF